jgi:anti-sigma B factor antagonist
MAEHTAPGDSFAPGPAGRSPAGRSPADGYLRARFDIEPGSGQRQPATVRAFGDIDLANVAQFEAALAEAAASSGEITADLTAVTYCDSAAIHALFTAARHNRLTLIVPETGPITTMLKVAGLDQITTVVIAR